MIQAHPKIISLNTSHVSAAVMALLVVAAALFGFDTYMQQRASDALTRLAPLNHAKPVKAKETITAFQRAATQRNDTMLLYGSSELNSSSHFRAGFFFRDAPTGFVVYPVGGAGTTSLVMLQKIASLGTALRGKKIALSISAPWMMYRDEPLDKTYEGNFHIQNARALLFQPDLSMSLKRQAAARMLFYPKTIEKDDLSLLAANLLVRDTPWDDAVYRALFPMAWLQQMTDRLQDDWEGLLALDNAKLMTSKNTASFSGPVDWQALALQAEQAYAKKSDNNPYGIANRVWNKTFSKTLDDPHSRWIDKTFKQRMELALEWQDLDLLLRSLKELGAQPLLLSMPLPNAYWNDIGLSEDARSHYYQRLQQIAAKYNVPVRDFHEFADDRYFMEDPMAHLSSEGWVYYDQALDAFYHDGGQ